ncbi:hypothetical protein OKA04_16365 [Luteolibacter flavescens]|uniref:EF-hand domain-containing protein n=1 Tax=Luteolibacter flavescens TaxID=1859460 RepID=A0ABT3FRW1_9BACT|nr:hypothetical protein [Luteolibacter flavescens]MCW1886313.1 hypothetical protein [Luteolibacter flavescens]
MIKSALLLSVIALAVPAFGGSPTPEPVPARKTFKQVVYTKLFVEADVDGDGVLDYEEFSKSIGGNPRPIVTQIRFDIMATDLDVIADRGAIIVVPERGILLEEFIEYGGGRKIKPTKGQIFDAADTSEDGFLDIEEFEATRLFPPSTPSTIFRAFDKMDKNDDALISPAEYGVKPIKA